MALSWLNKEQYQHYTLINQTETAMQLVFIVRQSLQCFSRYNPQTHEGNYTE